MNTVIHVGDYRSHSVFLLLNRLFEGSVCKYSFYQFKSDIKLTVLMSKRMMNISYSVYVLYVLLLNWLIWCFIAEYSSFYLNGSCL